MLSDFSGDVGTLDKPEQMMRTLAFIPRLEGRLRAMMFKSQLEVDMDGMLMQRVDDLRLACERVRDSKELHALLQVVLDVGNALNAGTSKGNAVGFKLSTLLKLADLKATDKKTTLLHYVVEVVRKNAPTIARVVELQKAVRDASRVSLGELQTKRLEAERGLQQVDTEITWHDEQRLRGGDVVVEDDQFPEVFTEFYNWASERKEFFDEALETATGLFREVCALVGEGEAKEPEEVFDTLEKFIVRFEAASKEVDDAKRAADEQLRANASRPTKTAKKELKSRASILPGAAKRMIGIRSKAAPAATAAPAGPAAPLASSGESAGAEAARAAAAPGGGARAACGAAAVEECGGLPQRRLSSSSRKKEGIFGASVGAFTQEMNVSLGVARTKSASQSQGSAPR